MTDLRDLVWKAQFKPTEDSALFEEKVRSAYKLSSRYESAQLLIGRSLALPSVPDPLPSGTKYFAKPIPGENLFGEQLDLWMAAIVVDGGLTGNSTIDDFRALVEAHWERGYRTVRDELESVDGNEIRLVQLLSDLLPLEPSSGTGSKEIGGGKVGEIRLKIGSISTSLDGETPVDFSLNQPGNPPHIALMGAIGKGKTVTGSQMAGEIVQKADIQFIFIDPKGEFVRDGAVVGKFAELGIDVEGVEVGVTPIPLDFLPSHSSAAQDVARASMRLRDSIAQCCRSPGDLQKDLLRTAIQEVIASRGDRSLESVRDAYVEGLMRQGKSGVDSFVSRLNELTDSNLPCFDPKLPPSAFFGKSWIISLKALPDELKRLVTMIILDSISSFLLGMHDSGVNGGYRVLRHLLVIDEARKILKEKRSESLVDLIRMGRSKGSVVMLLSQDPSDFEGESDDFTGQLGTVVAFSCNQSKKGLGALEGVFGRKLQAREFSDSYLENGVAFVKVPGSHPQRVRCWQP